MQAKPRLEWLSRGADLRVCPLCVAASDHEHSYLRNLSGSLDRPGQETADFTRAPGLCLDHLMKFEQVAVDADGAPGQDAVNLYLSTLQALAEQLSELEQDGWLPITECPVCAYRDHKMIATVQTFMTAVANEPHAVGETLQAGGLCVGHFVLTWVSSDESANRDLLRDIQFRAILDRIGGLERLRQADSGAESHRQLLDAWKRAARSLSGWTVTRR